MGSFSQSDLEYMFWNGLRNGSIGTVGAKGDPGGVIQGTNLGTEDLDTLRTSGYYRQMTAGNATAALHYPGFNQVGVLLVTEQNGTLAVIQHYYPIWGAASGRTIWMRTYTGSWSTWKAINSTRVDQTAGRAIYQWDDLNSREQLIYGDTGVRDLSAAGITNDVWTIGSLLIRRTGSTVCYNGYNLQQNGSASTLALNVLPQGFRPDGYVRFVARQHNAAPAFYSLEASSGNGAVQVYQTGITGAHFTVTWQTTDNWPATLPGTAVGTIPNL